MREQPDLDGPPPDPTAGIFETLLVAAGRAVELEAHLRRLRASAADLNQGAPPDDLEMLVAEHARDVPLGRLRLTLAPSAAPELAVAAVDQAIVFPGWMRPSELMPATLAGGLGCNKWADRRMLQTAEAAASPAVPLLVDRDGEVLETSRGNVFALLGSQLVTPPLDGRILPGVTRERVLGLARGAGLEPIERPMQLAELTAADELFTTGAIRGIEPVARSGETRWERGETTERLSSALRELWL